MRNSILGIIIILGITISHSSFASFTTEDSLSLPSARLIMDDRIYDLLHHPQVKKSNRVRGFRVQIYNGNDRTEANKVRDQFLQHYPRVPAYIIYARPNFRVRVGNFKSRQEATTFMRNLGNRYSSMIVPELIFTQ